MRYSLKTLIIAAGVLPLLAALVGKFGGLGLLFGLVMILVLIICYCFTRLPLCHAAANSILICAVILHVTLINFFFPIAAKWVHEAMSAAADRGHNFYPDQFSEQEFSMTGLVIIFGYLPAIIALFIWIPFIEILSWNGLTRLFLSLWLLIVPLTVGLFTIQHYRNL